jgi:hypothetical protein
MRKLIVEIEGVSDVFQENMQEYPGILTQMVSKILGNALGCNVQVDYVPENGSTSEMSTDE